MIKNFLDDDPNKNIRRTQVTGIIKWIVFKTNEELKNLVLF